MWINIVADAHIPFVEEQFGSLAQLTLVPGDQISSQNLKHCDALLVRSVTRVNEALLQNTPVKFVGSATAGMDHIDEPILKNPNIQVANAPAGNAESVVEYVLAALMQIIERNGGLDLERTIGIVGHGAIGSRLAARCEGLGMVALRNDPPLARKLTAQGRSHSFVTLESLLVRADIVSLHVPWADAGPDPTENLIGFSELELMKSDALLVNTSRGGIVNETALCQALTRRRIGSAVLDVWRAEPDFDCALHKLVQIGTPHIAGYSIDAKFNCTKMIADQLTSFFSSGGLKRKGPTNVQEVDTGRESFLLTIPPNWEQFGRASLVHSLIAQMYSVQSDHDRLQKACLSGTNKQDHFRRLRRQYPKRYTFSRYSVDSIGLHSDIKTLLQEGLGICLMEGNPSN